MKKLFTLLMLIPFAMICSCQKQDSAVEQQLAQRKAELEAREKAEAEREKALKALVEREKALAEREKALKALAEREKATASAHTISPDAQSRGQVTEPAQLKALLGQEVKDPAQRKAQQEKIIQQLPHQVQALIPDPAKVKADREARMQEQLARRQRLLEEFQRKGIEAKKTDAIRHAEDLKTAKEHAMRARTGAPAAPPSLAASPPPAYPGAEATSPPQLAPLSVYPQPEATSPPSLAGSPEPETASPTPSPTPQ
jgi:hypothetical protein